MKKSCSRNRSEVVITKNNINNINDCEREEELKEQLTPEQIYINKQLLESGIQEEGLGWLEKRDIFETIAVSLHCSDNRRCQRNSQKPTKADSLRSTKWKIENSLKTSSKEESERKSSDNENTHSSSVVDSGDAGKTTPESDSSLESKEIRGECQIAIATPKSNCRKKNSEKLRREAEVNGETPKSSKKIHYVKIEVEGDAVKETKAVTTVTTPDKSINEESQALNFGKKRSSLSEIDSADSPKKIKIMEQPNNNNNNTNNNVNNNNNNSNSNNNENRNTETVADDGNLLKTELELERTRHGVPFVRRDIKTILDECEFRNVKWKEAYARFKCPAQWGIPIVRNCEKWDGKQIPQKLLHRYEKYLSNNNILHPVFHPVAQIQSSELNKSACESVSSQSSAGTNSECRDDLDIDLKDINTGEGCLIQDDENNQPKKLSEENNLNASTSGSDSNGRMVLRNRNQYKRVVIDEEEDYSSDDWYECSRQKSKKKQRANYKNKKGSARENNEQLAFKLEKCNLNRRNGKGDRKSGNKSEVDNQTEGMNSSKSTPEPETMVCPICSLRFEKQLIESHATECASKTYKD